MVSGYRQGLTPNPDVECNRHIKFGLFYRRALREGADAIATGHYARLVVHDGQRWLAKALDSAKDQTYFLWGLHSEQLDRVLFPVGGLLKTQVRRIAAGAGLPTAEKKDSQGVCFVGQLDVKDFLLQRIASRRGRIVDVTGDSLGWHDGAAFYTIGQRHGLDIKRGAGPYYILTKNMHTNTITVGPRRGLYRTDAHVIEARWFGPRPSSGENMSAVIRYQSQPVSATVNTKGHIRFLRPVRAVAPGQSVVFYHGMRLIGGGTLRLPAQAD
jgi:tRNA-specific 2-thiouridylase